MGSKPHFRAKSEIYRIGGKIPEPTQKQRCHQPYFRANSETRRVTYLISEPTQKSNGFKATFQSQVRNIQDWRQDSWANSQKQRCHQPYFRANSETRRVTYLISGPTQKSNGFKATFQSQVRNLQDWRQDS